MPMRNNFAGQFRQKGHALAEDIKGIGEAVKGVATEKLEELKEGATSMGRRTRASFEGAVQSSPWKAIMIAAGLGAVAAFFLRRR